jgi:hypothetical protein
MRSWNWQKAVFAAAVLTLSAGPLFADGNADRQPTKELASFGTLRSLAPETARKQAETWLKEAGKTDEASRQQFAAIWDSTDGNVLDKVAQTLALGDEQARQLLAEARDFNAAAPTEVPAVLKDAKKPAFYRANLALAYAKGLSNRRVYEEALETLKAVKVEQVADPASYLFHRAVAEHAMLLKKEADESIVRLLDDVVDAPERYKMVAALMHFDMLTWRDKDLGEIARKMDNIERRLELTRGGKKTQEMQKEVVMRLDELIKKLENQQNGSGSGNGGSCPNGGQQPGNGNGGSNNPSSPMQDSGIANNSGPGNVDAKKLKEMAEVWGKLPEKERAKAMLELTRDMPPRYRQVIEDYFKNLNKVNDR